VSRKGPGDEMVSAPKSGNTRNTLRSRTYENSERLKKARQVTNERGENQTSTNRRYLFAISQHAIVNARYAITNGRRLNVRHYEQSAVTVDDYLRVDERFY